MVSEKDLTDIKLELLDLKDSQQLLDFEQQNRDWFEQFIPPREDNFYSSEGVVSHIQEFLLDYKCRQLLPLLMQAVTCLRWCLMWGISQLTRPTAQSMKLS